MAKRLKKRPEQDFVWSILKIFGTLLAWPLRIRSSGKKHNDKHQISDADLDRLKSKWSEVQELMQQNGPSHFRMAVMQADTALDSALKLLDMTGLTMGERLKSAERYFVPHTYNMIWRAHRVRNRLAHEIDSDVMHFEAREAVASFELALREIGVITDGFSQKV